MMAAGGAGVSREGPGAALPRSLLPHDRASGGGQTAAMWLFSLVLAGGLGTAPAPSPERLL